MGRPRRWFAACRAGIVALSLGVGSFCGAGAAAGRAAAGACTLPLTHDTYDGFHIGVPSGWELSTLGGLISVSRGGSGTEAALLYPALLANGQTADAFFSSYLKRLVKTSNASGGAVSYRLLGTAASPAAVLSGRTGGTDVSGRAAVFELHESTPAGKQVAVFSAWWAPVSRLSSDAALLSSIAACYGPEPATLYVVHQDRALIYGTPLGWSVTDEGQDNVDITGDGGRAYAGYLATLDPQAGAGFTATDLVKWIFGHVKITVTKVLSSSSTPAQRESNGAVQTSIVAEFLGTCAGHDIHGLVDVVCDAGVLVTGVERLGFTWTDRWNSDNGAVIHVMGDIQHNINVDLQQWQHLSQEWDQFSAQTQSFDNVLNNVDLVRDPETGQVYQAPYSAYSQSGPQGAGYYTTDGPGVVHKLQIIQPTGS